MEVNKDETIVETSKKSAISQDTNTEGILKVGSHTMVKNLASSIIATMKQYGYVELRCIGDGAIGRGFRASIIASGTLKIAGINLIMIGSFGTTEIDGKDLTVTKITLENR